jgi:hypothetical protein
MKFQGHRSAFILIASTVTVFLDVPSALGQYPYGLPLKRCENEQQFLAAGSIFDECPWLQGHASVTDHRFINDVYFNESTDEV